MAETLTGDVDPREAQRLSHLMQRRLGKSEQRKRIADTAEFMGEVIRKLRDEFSSLSKLTPEQVRGLAMVVRAQSDWETQVRLARGEPLPGVRRYAEETAKGAKRPKPAPAPEPAPIATEPPATRRPGPRPSSVSAISPPVSS